MADIIKKVNPGVPRNERHQTFTNADGGAGDIILVQESLGKYATKVIIDATNEMSVRFNVNQTVYPLRGNNSGLDVGIYGSTQPNISDGRTYVDETADPITIRAGEILELSDDLPVRDIQLTTVSGVFSIICI